MTSAFDKNNKLKKSVSDDSVPECEVNTFWVCKVVGRKKEITIDPVYLELKKWLHKQGYWRYVYGPDKWKLVQIKNNIVTEVFRVDVKREIFEYILSFDYTGKAITGNMVYEVFAGREGKIFSEGIFELMDSKEIVWNRDKKNDAYYYFKNKCVKVTVDGYDYIDYDQLPGMVWSSQIIQRDVSFFEEYERGEFYKFLRNVTKRDNNRFYYICTVLGYMLHGFKNRSYMPAVVFTDEIISDDPNGGSGKGIIASAVSYLRNTVFIDGKKFNINKNFVYQRVNLDTQVVVLEDVKKDFDLEQVFSLITEGIEVEKKNKDEFYIGFKDSPKLIVLTNYVLKGKGNSHSRRKEEIELHNHYNKEFTPNDDFGHLLFDDWEDQDWNLFYSFIFDCVKAYLNHGVVKSDPVNLSYKKILSETGKDFMEWANDNLVINTKYKKGSLFSDFTEQFPDYKNNKFKQNTFTKWMEHFGEFRGWKNKQWKSTNDRVIMFCDKDKEFTETGEVSQVEMSL